MSGISTHILDTSRGRPAAGVPAALQQRGPEGWTSLGRESTNADGRVPSLLPANAVLEPGVYRIRFDTDEYFAAQGVQAFYPEVSVVFQIEDAGQHYHVPLLLSPFGYSTYRGS
jgi:5-hydroxyisourate hydrolase